MRESLAQQPVADYGAETPPHVIAFENDPDSPESTQAFEEAAIDRNRIDVESIIALTARLAQVLAEEADMMAEMKVKEVASLQKEKLQLLDALEAQKKFADRNPRLLEQIDDEEALELAQIIEIFQNVLQENHQRLLVAREINRTVIEAITDTVSESARNGAYDETGKPEKNGRAASMSYNKTI